MKKTTKILLVALAVMMLTLVLAVASSAKEVEVSEVEELQSAISNADSGDTVKLLNSLTVSNIIVIDKAITLDGNGMTIESSAARAINVNCGGEVTIKNLTIVASGERAINVIQKPVTLTVDTVTAASANYTVNVAASAGAANVTIKGSDLTGLNVVNIAGAGAVVTISDTKITCDDQSEGEDFTALVLNPDATGATITVTDVEFDVKGDSKVARVESVNGAITIDGSTDDVVINVAIIEYGDYYKSFTFLADAVAGAQKGETVKLIADVVLTETLTISADKEITLDLNGKTISQIKECTENYIMLKNNGSLTITGNGKISFTDTGAGDSSFGWGTYTVCNNGTLVVENGTIENLSQQNSSTSVSSMYCAIFQYSGSTTINGGTISTPTYRSVRLWKGDMTINGGVFEGQVWIQSVDDTAVLTIKGGTFAPRGGDGSSVFVGNVTDSGKLCNVSFSVEGGSFTTKIGCSDATAIAGSVTGGTFTASAKENTNEALIASSFEFVENADGTFGVETSLKNIFTFIGYSIREDGTGITAGFEVDQKALAIYEKTNGVKVEYGSYFTLESMSNNAIMDSLAENRTGTYNLTIKGVTEAAYDDLALIMTMYVTDGEATEYVSSSSGLGAAENVTTITYNQIKEAS